MTVIQIGSKFFIDTLTVRTQPWILKTLERDFFRCVRCGEPKVEKLIVHHIDGSRKLGFKIMNNNLDNLITVCKPCHAKEHKQTIDDNKIKKIQELLLKDMSYSDIGKELGISRQRVHQILKQSKML